MQPEEGVDQGGLFKEFLCIFISDFLKTKNDLFLIHAVTQEIYIGTNLVLNEETKVMLEIFGILLGMSLKYSITL